jgi:hypothetical protein
MSSLLIKAKNLNEGDVLLLPFNKTATVKEVKPIGPRTRIVQFKTEFGWSRTGIDEEIFVQARVL